jgi:archaemetzincin
MTLLRPGPRHRGRPSHAPGLPPAAAPFAIQPLGVVAPEELRFLDEILGAAFGADTLLLPPATAPPSAFAPGRAQFDADVLLEELFARLPERCMRIIGVTESDLFVVGRTFVFGYAHLADGVALFSTARFREEVYGRRRDAGLLRARVSRAVVHEIGHTFGNPHCDDLRCVMRPVTHLPTLDALSPWFCRGCRVRVRDGLAVPPWSGRGRWERGLSHLRRREFARAAQLLDHAVAAAPLEARYHNDLGVARLGSGDRDGARAAFRRAAELGAEAERRAAVGDEHRVL